MARKPSIFTVFLSYLYNLPLVLPFTGNHQLCVAEVDRISKRLRANFATAFISLICWQLGSSSGLVGIKALAQEHYSCENEA